MKTWIDFQDKTFFIILFFFYFFTSLITMATRLDRLVLLLDTGSTTSVRTTAAQQMGEIIKQRPEDLHSLLAKVMIILQKIFKK